MQHKQNTFAQIILGILLTFSLSTSSASATPDPTWNTYDPPSLGWGDFGAPAHVQVSSSGSSASVSWESASVPTGHIVYVKLSNGTIQTSITPPVSFSSLSASTQYSLELYTINPEGTLRSDNTTYASFTSNNQNQQWGMGLTASSTGSSSGGRGTVTLSFDNASSLKSQHTAGNGKTYGVSYTYTITRDGSQIYSGGHTTVTDHPAFGNHTYQLTVSAASICYQLKYCNSACPPPPPPPDPEEGDEVSQIENFTNMLARQFSGLTCQLRSLVSTPSAHAQSCGPCGCCGCFSGTTPCCCWYTVCESPAPTMSATASVNANGPVCGISNQKNYCPTYGPTTNLCSYGTPSSVIENGALASPLWTWTCSYGGSTVGCTADIANDCDPIGSQAPNCGSANGSTIASKPATNLCGSSSSLSSTGVKLDTDNQMWFWDCQRGSATTSCAASSAR